MVQGLSKRARHLLSLLLDELSPSAPPPVSGDASAFPVLQSSGALGWALASRADDVIGETVCRLLARREAGAKPSEELRGSMTRVLTAAGMVPYFPAARPESASRSAMVLAPPSRLIRICTLRLVRGRANEMT